MAYEGQKRVTIYNLVAEELAKKLFFKKVKKQLPPSDPSGLEDPQAYLALLPETIEGFTNKERLSSFRMAVVLFVRAETDVDLAKLDAIDKAENAINNLQTNASFEAVGSLIHVRNIDPGPLALAVFGLDWEIRPPFGVVRLDVEVEFIYQAID